MENQTHKYANNIKLNEKKDERGEKMELATAIVGFICVIIISIYLILTDTDIIRIAKQYRKITILRIENDRLKESNVELREEYNNYLIIKYKYAIMLRSTILDLKHIQEINTTSMTDKEIIHERYIATENVLKDLNEKLKELDSSDKRSSSQLVK